MRFYKPEHARAGDTIPFLHDGVFHVFYLKRYADDTHDVPETSWWHVSTTDFADFVDHGVAIPRGDLDDADYSVATGSVVKIGDEFHAYYTGFRRWPSPVGRQQTVLRARSSDLITWVKDDAFSLVADESRFHPDEWRDPFVHFDAASGGYRMLIAAQRPDGPVARRGVLASASSPDGQDWTIDDEPFWAPGLFSMHECPDLFRMGEWWYLVYSTFSDRTVTRYRMSPGPDGPWTSPADDELDGLGFYAAKTLSDGERRYLVGWAVNRVAGSDEGRWLWGGNLLAHELHADSDGRLRVCQPAAAKAVLQSRTIASEALAADLAAPAGHATQTLAELPRSGLADLAIEPTPDAKAFGIELRVDEERRHGYSISFEPAKHRIVVDRVSRFGFDPPLDVRPWEVEPGPLELNLEFDGDLFVLYVNGRTAITLRGYDTGGAGLAVFATEGSLRAAGTLRSFAEPPPRL